MIGDNKVVALIPARGGSKRLPRKNIRSFSGKPLISWSIEAAQNSKYVDKVFVSTDDDEISKIAVSCGAISPEMRPAHLSSDNSSTKDVLLYTINKFFSDFDIVIILQPTSPLRKVQHIDEAVEFFIEKEACAVVSVTLCEHPPVWANTLPENKTMERFSHSNSLKRSQDIESYYRLNGSLYIYDVGRLIKSKDISYTKETYAYVMENIYSIDIDNKLDFEYAEFLHSKIIS
ncbi:acylneuraminate cytidylyltransferase family protein [Marinomonas arenicola]|uniref:Acylneuraminate cytidylyltransferase family protein n=1 Tax=Marinomonas arenicola TaxID=569601 RepID=A0ABU9G7S7_9GAMM